MWRTFFASHAGSSLNWTDLHTTDEQRAHDLTRDAFLCAQGFNVLRLPNDLVIGACDLALQQIDAAAERAKPSPALAGEGGLRRQPEPG
jgi:hypothetical protein